MGSRWSFLFCLYSLFLPLWYNLYRAGVLERSTGLLLAPRGVYFASIVCQKQKEKAGIFVPAKFASIG